MTECKYKPIIAEALKQTKKPILCFVWNDEVGSSSVALVQSIGVASGNYIDFFYRTWLNAEPISKDDVTLLEIEND